jgi:hypothetical protein
MVAGTRNSLNLGNNILDSVDAMNVRSSTAPSRSIVPSYVLERLESLMRVEDHVIRTVVFVGIEVNGTFTPLGTGFLVAFQEGELSAVYLVTADHVVNQISGEYVYVRINRVSGASEGCVTTRVDKRTILRHNDKRNDIAVFPFPYDTSAIDCMPVMMGKEQIKGYRANIWEPGLGDEVALVGLYTTHYGMMKNRPVVKIGNIAAMPEEPVRTDVGYVTAYLIEIRSIAGLSGSPIFLNVPHMRVKDGQIQTLSHAVYQPLGMLIGYHMVESREDQIKIPRESNFSQTSAENGISELNTGFGVAIPIERLNEILESDEVTKMRKDAVSNHHGKSGYIHALQQYKHKSW